MTSEGFLYKDVTKYQHLNRLGANEVFGILDGTVIVQEKLDGANATVFWDNESNDYVILSRNNVVYHNGQFSNNMFSRLLEHIKEVNSSENPVHGFDNFFRGFPEWILRGEYLTPHVIKYPGWENKFIVFDVQDRHTYEYIHYNTYNKVLPEYGITYIPFDAMLEYPSREDLLKYIDRPSNFGAEYREGIVVKRYDYKNKYGRTNWAKILRSEIYAPQVEKKVNPRTEVEQEFANKFITQEFVYKEILKLRDAGAVESIKDMPKILGKLSYEVFQEEMWSYISKQKNNGLNFNIWRKCVTSKIKEYVLEYFNDPNNSL